MTVPINSVRKDIPITTEIDLAATFVNESDPKFDQKSGRANAIPTRNAGKPANRTIVTKCSKSRSFNLAPRGVYAKIAIVSNGSLPERRLVARNLGKLPGGFCEGECLLQAR
jgi:hypothetical protein